MSPVSFCLCLPALLLQLYNFEDKGGRRVALRPELTPSLARLVLQASAAAASWTLHAPAPACQLHQQAAATAAQHALAQLQPWLLALLRVLQKGKGLALPAKWFSIGQCWRYERATRGRRREHYQWNMDIVGVAGALRCAVLRCAVLCLLCCDCCTMLC